MSKKRHKTIDLTYLNNKLQEGDTISLKDICDKEGNLRKFKFVSISNDSQFTMEACKFCCFDKTEIIKNCYALIPCKGGYFVEHKIKNRK